jgi:tRNA(Arg) A34 adenosine deaminase TadA
LNGRVPNDERYLLAAIELAQRAREHGNHPFGSLLVDGDGNVLVECENTTVTERDSTGHAELNVIREASKRFDSAFQGRCTLYASTEPCAMCAGAIFWAGVRRVVFALSTDQLLDILGGNPDGPTLKFSCREVFARVNQEVEVSGLTCWSRRAPRTRNSGPKAQSDRTYV